MKTFDYNKIVARLVTVLSDAELTEHYNYDGQRNIIPGWYAVTVGPMSRVSFVLTFGQELTEKAEAAARAELAARAAAFAATHYFAHEMEAYEHVEQGQPVPAAGSFVWALDTGLKCENGLPDAIEALLWKDSRGDKVKPHLAKVCAVYHCTAEEMTDNRYAAELVNNNMPFAGGSQSDDVDEIDRTDPHAYDTFYTLTAAVVDPSGRWYLIDSEGYNYARYILLPLNARNTFDDVYTVIKEREEKRKADEKAKEEAERAARRAAYDARCAKWAPLMEDITDKTDDRARGACNRRNIAAMIHAVFPGLKLSIKRNKWYYGTSYEVSWIDGPTEEEMKAATDLDLFTYSYVGYNPYDETADITHVEFTDFYDRYFDAAGEIKLGREVGEEKKAEARAALTAAVPSVDWQKGNYIKDSIPVLDAICAAGLMPEGNYGRAVRQSHDTAQIVRLLAESKSYYTAPAKRTQEKKEAAAPANITAAPTMAATTATDGTQTAAEDAPHVSLTLCDMAGGVFVAGSSRATYCNRRAIKDHGATWNKKAQRWEARTSEAVASLRSWFALRAM